MCRDLEEEKVEKEIKEVIMIPNVKYIEKEKAHVSSRRCKKINNK